jgi:hypothetical protein
MRLTVVREKHSVYTDAHAQPRLYADMYIDAASSAAWTTLEQTLGADGTAHILIEQAPLAH